MASCFFNYQAKLGGIGSFKIGRSFFNTQNAAALEALFAGMVIISAEPDWDLDNILYRAYSKSFRKIESGQIIPRYIPKINIVSSGILECTNYYRIEWEEIKEK